MTQVALQYAVGSKLTDAFHSDMRVIGYETILDVDASETPYTADYTITAQDQSVAFLILTDAVAGTMTVTLYHGTTHATLVDTAALVRLGGSSLYVPAASVVLSPATAIDRVAMIGVNPGAREMSGSTIVAYLGTNSKVSLKLTTNGSYSDGSTVQIVCLGCNKRHSPSNKPV